MGIKVTKATVKKGKIASEIDIFDGIKLPRAQKKRVAEDVSDLLKTSILQEVGNTRSPLAGLSWPSLSKDYKKFKTKKNLPGKANLEFSGEMLDDFDTEVKDSGKIELNVTGDKSAAKADGHNNFSGQSNLPLRRFLPKEEDRFKKGIETQVNEIVARAVGETVKLPVRKLSNVTSKTGFFEVLREVFPGFSISQITDAVVANEDLLEQLTQLGLIRFLRGES